MFEIDYLNLYVWQGGDNYAQNNVQPFLPANIYQLPEAWLYS